MFRDVFDLQFSVHTGARRARPLDLQVSPAPEECRVTLCGTKRSCWSARSWFRLETFLWLGSPLRKSERATANGCVCQFHSMVWWSRMRRRATANQCFMYKGVNACVHAHANVHVHVVATLESSVALDTGRKKASNDHWVPCVQVEEMNGTVQLDRSNDSLRATHS